MNSQEVLKRLQEGNERFLSGVRTDEPRLSCAKMAELAVNGQKPFVIVLTCSDSRSPVELVFDLGVGDVFVVRVAGNVVAPSLLASIEFAAANFGSPLVLVMGHTQCGAVSATYQHVKKTSETLPSIHLEELVSRIRPAVEKVVNENHAKKEDEILELCSVENVKRSMKIIEDQSKIVRDLIQQNQIKIVGAILNIHTGKVQLLP